MDSSYIKTTGFVLNSKKHLNSSKIISFFTPEYGKLKLIAQGARRPKNNFGLSLEVSAYSEIVFIHNYKTSSYLIKESDLLNILEINIENYKKNLYLLSLNKLLDQVLPIGEINKEIFYTYYKFAKNLHLLDNEDIILRDYLKVIFDILAFLGYPLKGNCNFCGEKKLNYYDYGNYGFVCKDCQMHLTSEHIGFSPDISKILTKLFYAPNNNVLKINKLQFSKINDFISKYLKYYISEFYKNESLEFTLN